MNIPILRPVPRISSLDGLRGLLALWVSVSHIFCWCGYSFIPNTTWEQRLWAKFVFAQGAVEVFMILSGFAIAQLLRHRNPSYLTFIANRVLRIYPTYFFCLGLGFLASYLTPVLIATLPWSDNWYFAGIARYSEQELNATVPHLLWHISLLNGLVPRLFLPEATATFLPPGWSITLEWQFYLVAPLLLTLLRKPLGLVLLLLAAAAIAPYTRLWENPHLAFLGHYLPLFLLGILSQSLSRLLVHGGASGFKTVRSELVAFTFCFVSILFFSGNRVALVLWMAVFLSIIAKEIRLPSRPIWFGVNHLLEWPIAQWLGRMSYSLYLIHWPVIVFLFHGLLYLNPNIEKKEALLIMLFVGQPIILVLSRSLHFWIENPFMRRGQTMLKQQSVA